MHTAIPFERAHDRSVSDTVAIAHYEYLKRGLKASRLSATPYNIALAWNSGLGAVVGGRSPRVAHQYAHRAANLASSFAGAATPKPGAPVTPVLSVPTAKPVDIYFAGIPALETGPTINFQWTSGHASAPRIPDFNAAFRGNMRVSLTE